MLLGDPGSGKSHTFRELAHVANGTIVTARQYLILPPQEITSPVFIDALDERRAGRDDNDTIDQILQKLFGAPKELVRISCRDRDWLGDTDLAAFKTYFDRNGGVYVLQLLDLSTAEQVSVLTTNAVADAEAFLADAEARGLSEFLTNPQNLLMLAEVVGTGGGWPTTFKELFERYTTLLLAELNAVHTGTGLGRYSPDEVLEAAGATCALRLISDVEGISLENNTSQNDLPSYRSIKLADLDLVRAALTRRLFSASSKSNAVTYTHRTTAEFLAAKWLAHHIRNGYPVGRLQALIGVDGHPAAELRGLNSWLAVHLPEHAPLFISADPNGILVYGDVASLTPSARLCLLECLSIASESDPWMRTGNLPPSRIASLFGADTVEEFRNILTTSTTPFPLKHLALEAVIAAKGGSTLLDVLEIIVNDQDKYYAERMLAVDAILQADALGVEILRKSYFGFSKNDSDTIRLKSHIAMELYGNSINATNIGSLLASALDAEDELPGGTFWGLPERIPVSDAKHVLNALTPAMKRLPKGRRSRMIASNVIDVVDRLIVRALDSASVEPHELGSWLKARRTLSDDGYGRKDEGLRPALLANKPLLFDLVRKEIARAVATNLQNNLIYEIQQTTSFTLSTDEIATEFFAALSGANGNANAEAYLYPECIRALMNSTFDSVERFELLARMAEDRAQFAPILDDFCKGIPVPDRPFRIERLREEEAQREGFRQSVEKLREQQEEVRTGKFVNWLVWLKNIYFAEFDQIDRTVAPLDRLLAVLGPDLLSAGVDCLKASLQRQDFPKLETVVDLQRKGRWFEWWHAILAGIDLIWAETTSIAELSDDQLAAAIAIDLLHPTWEYSEKSQQITRRGWRNEVEGSRPKVALATYIEIAEASLDEKRPGATGLREALSEQFLTYNRGLGLELLRKYPNADAYTLRELLSAAKKGSAVSEILAVASVLLSSNVLEPHSKNFWLITGYLCAPESYRDVLVSQSATSPNLVWLLRDLSGSGFGEDSTSELALDQLETIFRITAAHYTNVPHPTGGWSGDTNPWDGAEYAKTLISRISANTSRRAGEILESFLSTVAYDTYRDNIKHALANHAVRRREAEYQQPNWQATNIALANGPPANPADLAALTFDHMRDIAVQIAASNVDLYKQFWNEDSYSRTESPKSEESGRDALLVQLRARLFPLGVLVEPESHMAGGKRADISTALPGRKTFVELKRSYHPELWTAINNQLERFYTRDPEASGYGIYAVLWFGTKYLAKMPTPPKSIIPPKTPRELEVALFSLLTPQQREKIKVIVLDCSGEIPK